MIFLNSAEGSGQYTSPRGSSIGPRSLGRGSQRPDITSCVAGDGHMVTIIITWSHEPDTERLGSRPEQIHPEEYYLAASVPEYVLDVT